MDRTVLDLTGPKIIDTIPPRPACPPWCVAKHCQVVYDESWDGWTGVHADEPQIIHGRYGVMRTVQIEQFVTSDGSGDRAPGIHLSGNADGIDAMTTDEATALAAALLSASARLRAASRPAVLAAA